MECNLNYISKKKKKEISKQFDRLTFHLLTINKQIKNKSCTDISTSVHRYSKMIRPRCLSTIVLIQIFRSRYIQTKRPRCFSTIVLIPILRSTDRLNVKTQVPQYFSTDTSTSVHKYIEMIQTKVLQYFDQY